ncbi:hypothetical protein K9M79_05475 [Candidatus Woesearchaeota archaeon]|nr:hypothetical protein [Candidatus Woesearchaeota archaeon]
MGQLNELEKNFIEEFQAAELLIGNSMTKSALILYSKALFALTDYLILLKYNKLAKNHSERFRILKIKEPQIYNLIDSVWNKYTDSYSKPSNNESVNLYKTTIIGVIQNEKFSEKIKKIVE